VSSAAEKSASLPQPSPPPVAGCPIACPELAEGSRLWDMGLQAFLDELFEDTPSLFEQQ
jgi:hypothetical protein